MGYTNPDPYHQPEHFSLETVGSIEWDEEAYQFNITVVWKHGPTGRFYLASDAGCSCPSPFESLENANVNEVIAQLEHVPNLAYLKTNLETTNGGEYRLKYDSGDVARCAIGIREMLDRARAMGLR